MDNPAVILGFVLSTLYGAAFHLVRGGNLGRLLMYLVLSWIGFALGQIISSVTGWSFYKIGSLNLVFGTVFSFIFLIIGYWLSPVTKSKNG